MSIFPQPLLDSLAADPSRVVFEHGDRHVTARETLATVRRMAGALRAAGIGRASGVAMVTSVTPEAYAAYVAAHALGCRVIGVRPGYSRSQLTFLLSAGVDVVVVDGTQPVTHPRLLTIAALNQGAPVDVEATGRAADIARLVYTSGSTGAPKGCAWSHRAMSAHWSWAPDRWDESTKELSGFGERYLLFSTLASAVVQDYLALALLAGGTAVIPEAGRPMFPHVVKRLDVTGSIMDVPRLYRLLDVLRTVHIDMTSLRGLVVAGSPLPKHRLAEAVERLGPVMYQAYGQSETGNLTMLTPAHIDRHGSDVLETVGRPHADVEIDVRDGELYVRNPYLMSGYWRDHEQTAEVLVDGWIRTHDLGYLDDAGFLHLTGRARDVIIVDALPYYVGPIEAVLSAQPDVDQAYVVGAPDEPARRCTRSWYRPPAGDRTTRTCVTPCWRNWARPAFPARSRTWRRSRWRPAASRTSTRCGHHCANAALTLR
jgi:acyl-CoA synthetase (AMP-forming)/AMP-acid ligase II